MFYKSTILPEYFQWASSPQRRWLTGSFNNEFPLIALIAGRQAGNGSLMAATWRVRKMPSITHSLLQVLDHTIANVLVLVLDHTIASAYASASAGDSPNAISHTCVTIFTATDRSHTIFPLEC